MLTVLSALALAACGSGEEVDTSKYTCDQFNRSLAKKGDDSAGNFINRLREQAKLGQPDSVERRELSLGIFFACRGQPGSTRPGQRAVAIAKQIKAGTFHLPKPAKAPEKSSGK
jgi:hypothetical protein